MTHDVMMRRTKLGSRAAATNADLLLVQDALVQIRTMAYLRREVAAREDEPPIDYHERIRLIADACHNLPGYLRAGRPAQGLREAWHNADAVQQEWLRDTLEQHGVVISELVDN